MNNNQRFERTCYLYLHSRKCVIGVLTRLRVGHSGFRIPAKQEISVIFCLYCLWDPTDFLLNGNRAYLQWVKRRGREVTTHLHQVLTLRKCGAIRLLPLYALIEWTEITLPFTAMFRAMIEAAGLSIRS